MLGWVIMRWARGRVNTEVHPWSRTAAVFCLFVMCLSSCRSVPLEHTIEAPLPAAWAQASTADRDEAIWRASRKARGWTVERIAPGRFRGTWKYRHHLAITTLTHDGSRVAVAYQHSENLLESREGRIHRNYHVAVNRLIEKILAEPVTRESGRRE